MNQRKRWIGGLCVSACLAAGGIVTGAGADDDVVPVPTPEGLSSDAPPVDSIEADQAEKIAQLRRSRTSDDAMPPYWREAVSDGESWGANPSLSRRTAPNVWIVPGEDHVCLANVSANDGGLGLGCASPEDVERGLLAPSDVDANGNGVVNGVMPDGVGAVTLVNHDGSTRAVPVERNVYTAPVDANLKEIRFTTPEGGTRVLPMSWRK